MQHLNKISLALISLLTLGAAVNAGADTVVYQVQFPPTNFPFPAHVTGSTETDTNSRFVNFTFPKFPPSGGTLTGVRIMTDNAAAAQFVGNILASPPLAAGVNANLTLNYIYTPPGFPLPITCSLFFNQSDTFTPTKTSVTFNYPAQSCSTGFTPAPASSLPLYVGTGTVVIPLRMDFVQQATISNTGMAYQFAAATTSLVTLDYDYTPPSHSLSGRIALQGIVSTAPAQEITLRLHPSDGSASTTLTVSVPPSGDFTVNLPAKNYTVSVKGNKWLATSVPIDLSSGDRTGVQISLRAGDTNGDNAADGADLFAMLRVYNSLEGEELFNSQFDLNDDGAVDFGDLVLLLSNYNELGDPL